jgi:hypothetical protein
VRVSAPGPSRPFTEQVLLVLNAIVSVVGPVALACWLGWITFIFIP